MPITSRGFTVVGQAVLMSAGFAPPSTVKDSSLCFGMMYRRMYWSMAGAALGSVRRMVYVSTFSNFARCPPIVNAPASPARASGFCTIWSYVKTTSSAVNGWPSCHFTSCRRKKV